MIASDNNRSTTKQIQPREKLVLNGGSKPHPDLRGQAWRNAHLLYRIAIRQMEKVRRKDQLRRERQQEWDKAHKQADLANNDEGWGSEPSTTCPVCVAEANGSLSIELEEYWTVNDREIAWWERTNMVGLSHEPSTPPRPRHLYRPEKPVATKGSPSMRETIRQHRTALATAEAEHQQFRARWKTEIALREKHRLTRDFILPENFWNEPISDIMTRRNYRQIQDYNRMSERRARGNTPRPLPPRSSLSIYESAEDVEVDQDVQAKDEKERMQSKARKIGATVGYLYFVGKSNMLEDWKEDFLRSDHTLVNRHWELPIRPPSERDVVQSAESTDSSHSADSGDSMSTDELMAAFLEPEMMRGEPTEPMEVEEQFSGDELASIEEFPEAMAVDDDEKL
ncbi:hypothetical protein N0V90_001203 [Kalmusia sp. IMI 367209]|nr:hypothetical protein N0V90_001203 [Kalmusia sp. IMI 367209]